ncbi:MAG TPA: FAD-dependent oxidoreductase [Candidatus Angelobacter sp.]|nr:FAD-dependent oxidoreductase [Candidatus Angelobacter sp.]
MRADLNLFLNQKFDVVVVGGGINGVAIARECARRGIRTLILEQNDFAAGTTSRSTRIIHGGLRYLERNEMDMVRACIREQQHMLSHSHNLVRPVQFLLTLPPEPRSFLRSSLAIRSVLWAYYCFTHKRPRQNNDSLARDIETFERHLDNGRKWSVYSYDDAQCEFPERLVAEWLVEGMAAGAIAANHTEVLKINRINGRVSDLRVRNTLTRAEGTVKARWVINATGPWADFVIEASKIDAQRMVSRVRGSHLVLPLFPGAPKYAIHAEEPEHDSFFVLPWNGQLLVGATAVPDSGSPEATQPSATELEYLMGHFATLFPASGLTQADIRYAFAGVYSLPYSPGTKISRIRSKPLLHHHCEEGVIGLISVIGGTLSTATTVAKEAVQMMGLAAPKAGVTVVVPPKEEEMEISLQQWTQMVAAKADVSDDAARALTEWHGRHAMDVAHIASLNERLREPICNHTPHLVAEAVHAARHECAVTLADIVLRRVPVALGPCWSETCGWEAARKIGEALGWQEQEMIQQLQSLEEERQNFLHPRIGLQQPVKNYAPVNAVPVQEPAIQDKVQSPAKLLPYRDVA